MLAPETRSSLLVSVEDLGNANAWAEFVDIYGPAIYRFVRAKGLQDADASDVTQGVLLSVAQAIRNRRYDATKARFRTWLAAVTTNAVRNAISRIKPDRATGGEAVQSALSSIEARDDESLLQHECDKERFRYVAKQVEQEFEDRTWQAFWRSTVDAEPIAQVAEALGLRAGSVYAARSRVMRRLREAIAEIEEHEKDLE